MITKAHDLLRDDDTLLAEEQAQTKFILVDEFQDANFAQVKILGGFWQARTATSLRSAIQTRRFTVFVELRVQRSACSKGTFLMPGW